MTELTEFNPYIIVIFFTSYFIFILSPLLLRLFNHLFIYLYKYLFIRKFLAYSIPE